MIGTELPSDQGSIAPLLGLLLAVLFARCFLVVDGRRWLECILDMQKRIAVMTL